MRGEKYSIGPGVFRILQPKSTIDNFVDALFLDNSVVYVNIFDDTQAIATRVRAEFEGQDFSFFEQSSRFVVKQSRIAYEGSRIGTVQIALSYGAGHRGRIGAHPDGAVTVAIVSEDSWWRQFHHGLMIHQGTMFEKHEFRDDSPRARDIALGGDQWLTWFVGMDGRIYRGYGNPWSYTNGLAREITADHNNVPWIVQDNGSIWRYLGSDQWENIPGYARDIGVGANDDVWIVGEDAHPGGYRIYRWNGSGWDASRGNGGSVAVDQNGGPWITQTAQYGGQIWRL